MNLAQDQHELDRRGERALDVFHHPYADAALVGAASRA